MLTDSEKAELKNEEIYRQEIRDELSQGVNKKSWTWEFLNSSIFLWFLSTVAVGGITYGWTVHQNRLTDESARAQKETEQIQARTETIHKLNLEIESRLSQFLVDVEHMVKKPYNSAYSLEKPYALQDIRKQWNLLKIPPRYSQTPSNVYQDFSERGLVSLIIELDDLEQKSKSEEEQKKKQNTGNTVVNASNNAINHETEESGRRLRQVAVDIQDDTIFDNIHTNDFLPVYVEFNKKIKKWNSMFPYMDCPVSSPFC